MRHQNTADRVLKGETTMEDYKQDISGEPTTCYTCHYFGYEDTWGHGVCHLNNRTETQVDEIACDGYEHKIEL